VKGRFRQVIAPDRLVQRIAVVSKNDLFAMRPTNARLGGPGQQTNRGFPPALFIRIDGLSAAAHEGAVPGADQSGFFAWQSTAAAVALQAMAPLEEAA
jgi:hypothetical protein